jgi:hypothetical protein
MHKGPLPPKLINGKVWVADKSSYRKLPEDDPSYGEILLQIDSQRFVELLAWVYNRKDSKNPRRNGHSNGNGNGNGNGSRKNGN